jgi:hypothetical protein
MTSPTPVLPVEHTELESILESLAHSFSSCPLRPLYTCHTAQQMDEWWMQRYMEKAAWVGDTAKRAIKALAASPPPQPAPGDAERYRWLRDKSEPGICAFYLSVGQAFKGVRFTRETVDAAIDAAMAGDTPIGGQHG